MAIFIDTNIFMEIIARKGAKSDKSLALLNSGEPLWTTAMVFAEIEWVLRDGYDFPKEKIIRTLKKVLSYQNIEIETKKILSESVALYEANNIDWTDCYNIARIKAEEQNRLYSYDKHFDKIDGIARLEP